MAADLRQIKLIGLYSIRYSVRGGVGLVFLLVALGFGLVVAQMMLQPVEVMTNAVAKEQPGADREEIAEKMLDRLVVKARPAVSWVLGAGAADDIEDPLERQEVQRHFDEWAQYLLGDRPALLSAILLILLWGWPFIVGVGAFDIYTGDIASRGLRYQLLRAERGTIYFGRLLGTLFTFAAVLVLLVTTVVVYMGFKLPFYSWPDLIVWGAIGFVMLVVLSLPYVALCAWISAATSSPFASLTVCSLAIGAPPLFALIGKLTHPAAAYANYLLPWGIQPYLFSNGAGTVLLAVLGCLAYTALFVFLGHRKLSTRDL